MIINPKFKSTKSGRTMITKVIVGISLLAFVFLSLFCTSFGVAMEDHSTGMGCHFMGLNNVDCPMSISHHVSKWLNTFAGLPKTDHFLAFVFLFVILTAWNFFRREFAQALSPPDLAKHALRTINFDCNGRDRLIRAFSAGIIHPQIYNI